MSEEFKKGDIVKYSDGPTAIVKLESPHAGGWHANHCLGGVIFVSDFNRATPAEIEVAMQSRFCVWRLPRCPTCNSTDDRTGGCGCTDYTFHIRRWDD